MEESMLYMFRVGCLSFLILHLCFHFNANSYILEERLFSGIV